MKSLWDALRCKFGQHDYDVISGVPAVPELRPNGRRKLYKMILVCARCGHRGN